MRKTNRLLLLSLLLAVLVCGGCGILKKNSCGCPPIPTAGRMDH
jgi:hypothetical protein